MILSEEISIIGVDLGGTKVAAGRMDNHRLNRVIHELIPAESEDPQEIIQSIIQVIRKLFTDKVVGIGIGIPGLVDRDLGVVSDIQNIPSWKEIALKEILENHFGVPVFLDNDANCYALGELRFGKGKGEDDFVGLTLGTGMGAGIIKNGLLLPDAHCGSGEFGNIPYLNGMYEDYCSGKFFKKQYDLSGEAMAEAAKSGDRFALQAFEIFGKHLANAIKTIKLAIDPKKIIIGGSVAKSNAFFALSMQKHLLDFPFPKAMYDFDVVFSDIKHIAVLGAASLYYDKTKKELLENQVLNQN